MNLLPNLADATVWRAGIVAVVALGASFVGGVTGYGVGLILPVFLAPLVGIENVVPVMAVGMTLTNTSRVIAFWSDIRWVHARRLLLLGLPTCLVGAGGFALLTSRWIAILLGCFLMASIPLRRLLQAANWRLGPVGERFAGACFGIVNGGLTGTGPVLSCILMAVGAQGAALIGTDAIVSMVLGVAKVAVFGGLSKINLDLLLVGLLIGISTLPGAFVARRLLARVDVGNHTRVMELVVFVGGVTFLWRGLTEA